MFNALFNYEIKSLGLYMYFIIHSFSALSRLRMFAITSDALYRSIGIRQAVIRLRPKYTCKNSFQKKLDVDTLAEF